MYYELRLARIVVDKVALDVKSVFKYVDGPKDMLSLSLRTRMDQLIVGGGFPSCPIDRQSTCLE